MSVEDIKIEIINFYNLINKNTKKYTFSELKKVVFNNDINNEDFENALLELEIEGILFHDRINNTYRLFPHELGYVQGVLKINKHDEGFVEYGNKKYIVKPQELNGALDGDLVVLRPKRNSSCSIEKIVKRGNGFLVVEVVKENDEFKLKPYSAFFPYKLTMREDFMKIYVEGDRLLVKLDALEPHRGGFDVDLVKHVGHKDDPDSEYTMIAVDNKIPTEFPEDVLAESDSLPTTVLPEEYVGRRDYRSLKTFSIDGASTKDRDDALTVIQLPNGNTKVIVQISDVTHYVHPGMKLWDEAMKRGTSVYMVDTVIPMLPHKLSNGICSLNEGVDRLTLSCELELTPDGDIVSYDFVDGVINSNKAMTYDDVNEILENGNVPEGYEDYVKELTILNNLAKKLEKKKIDRGYVNFGTNDLEIEKDDKKNPIHFQPRVQRSAEKLIENFMLLAGMAAADYLVIPSPYRVHEAPEPDKVESAFSLLKKSGIKVREMHEIVNGKVIQQILNQIKDMDDREVAAAIILRAMNRASYSVINLGHFGLALAKYLQFTSPIRRAPDLRVHYNIKLQRDKLFDYSHYDEYESEIASFSSHASLAEKRADTAQREANKVEMVKYMEDHLGEKFEVIVTYVSSQGIYVRTTDGIEGKIDPHDLEGDTFIYDERSASYRGKKSKLKIKIGNKLLLTAVDIKRQWKVINFGLERDDFKRLIKTRV